MLQDIPWYTFWTLHDLKCWSWSLAMCFRMASKLWRTFCLMATSRVWQQIIDMPDMPCTENLDAGHDQAQEREMKEHLEGKIISVLNTSQYKTFSWVHCHPVPPCATLCHLPFAPFISDFLVFNIFTMLVFHITSSKEELRWSPCHGSKRQRLLACSLPKRIDSMGRRVVESLRPRQKLERCRSAIGSIQEQNRAKIC